MEFKWVLRLEHLDTNVIVLGSAVNGEGRASLQCICDSNMSCLPTKPCPREEENEHGEQSYASIIEPSHASYGLWSNLFYDTGWNMLL